MVMNFIAPKLSVEIVVGQGPAPPPPPPPPPPRGACTKN